MPHVAPIRPARELKSDAGDAERAPAELVDELATELNLLSESRTNPDAFFERRDFLVKRLRRLAKRLGGHTHAPIAVLAGVYAPKPRTRSTDKQDASLPAMPRLRTDRELAAQLGLEPRPLLTLKGSHATR